MSKLIRIILWPFSLIYRMGIFAWDIYWRKARKVKLPCRVISVGNITAGGSGKTPIVILLAKIAVESGAKTAVVARGYKRKSSGLAEISDESIWEDVGDEPLEIHRLTNAVRVYVHESKTSAAKKACDDGADVIIIDDGFQHRKLQRDFDIVCLDSKKPFGSGGLLPSGLLREPAKNIQRADVIIYTSYAPVMGSPPDFEFHGKIFYAETRIKSFLHILKDTEESAISFEQKKAIAFCGLANPDKFVRCLKALGMDVIEAVRFADHYHYKQADIDNLVAAARKLEAACLITTFKDAVKIGGFDFGGIDIYSAMLEISINDKSGSDRRREFSKLAGL